MNQVTGKSLRKHTSAWLPILLSLVALILIVGYVGYFGVSQPAPDDEITPARVFQVLMGSQVFILTYFAARHLPENPKQGLQIIAAQIIAAIVPIITVFLLEM